MVPSRGSQCLILGVRVTSRSEDISCVGLKQGRGKRVMSKPPHWKMPLPGGLLVPLLLIVVCGGWHFRLPAELNLRFHQWQWANHHIVNYRCSVLISQITGYFIERNGCIGHYS